jgi:hypothetical protein
VQLCESRCEEETTTEILNDVQGKVVINNTYINDAGETVAVYAITTNPDDLDKDTWELFSGFVLAPCNLPESYKKENLGVVISGRKRSCCNQLTQPNFKSAYGCKFEITKIRVR